MSIQDMAVPSAMLAVAHLNPPCSSILPLGLPEGPTGEAIWAPEGPKSCDGVARLVRWFCLLGLLQRKLTTCWT